MTTVAIGIPTYNGAERVRVLLTSIRIRTPRLALGNLEIVLVDDGSPRSDETSMVASSFPDLPLQYIAHGNNRGIAAAWNTAVRATDAEVVVLSNDDVIVPSGGWLEALVHVLDCSPGVGVVGSSWHAFTSEDVPALLATAGSDAFVVPRDPGTKAPDPERRTLYEDVWPGRVMCPTGQLFAFRRSDFDDVGGFDEQYKSFYEESDFGTSLAARGLIGMQLTWPFSWHMWSATFGASPELCAEERLLSSRACYRRKWCVPPGVAEFEHTGKHLDAIGDVPVSFLRSRGVARGTLLRDGTFVEAP